jgi:hypothetical protein
MIKTIKNKINNQVLSFDADNQDSVAMKQMLRSFANSPNLNSAIGDTMSNEGGGAKIANFFNALHKEPMKKDECSHVYSIFNKIANFIKDDTAPHFITIQSLDFVTKLNIKILPEGLTKLAELGGPSLFTKIVNGTAKNLFGSSVEETKEQFMQIVPHLTDKTLLEIVGISVVSDRKTAVNSFNNLQEFVNTYNANDLKDRGSEASQFLSRLQLAAHGEDCRKSPVGYAIGSSSEFMKKYESITINNLDNNSDVNNQISLNSDIKVVSYAEEKQPITKVITGISCCQLLSRILGNTGQER